MDAEDRTVVWSDITCPWAHAAVARLHRYRAKLGLDFTRWRRRSTTDGPAAR